MIVKFILKALIAALGLWLADQLIAGISFDGLTTLLIAAVLLGIVNALVRPVIFVLTLPITIVTLGLFLLVVNAAMIGLVAFFLKGFAVDGLVPGVLAAVITGVVSWIGQIVIRDK